MTAATALVTRPLEDAQSIATALSGRGFSVRVEPLLKIRIFNDQPLNLLDIQAVLATSANGVRALAANLAERNLPVLAVGEATAACARDAGFAEVVSAGGDVGSLAALVSARLKPQNGPLLHAAGTQLAGDLAGLLAADGFEVRRAVLYEAVGAESLSGELQSALQAGTLDLALFFSPRTAQTFVRLTKGAGLQGACGRITSFALSQAVADRLAELPWRAVRTSSRPDQQGLLLAIDKDFPEGKRNG